MKLFIDRRRLQIDREGSDGLQDLTLPVSRQSGFTLIEVLVSVVLLAGLLVGFRYTLLAYWQQINRSWAERYMEQYGNSTVEYLARNLVNAKTITISPNAGDLTTFFATYNNNINQYTIKYSCTSDGGVEEDNEKLFSDFPPDNFADKYSSILGVNEKFEIIEFKIDSVYKNYTPYFNPNEFKGRLFKITLRIAFEQDNTNSKAQDYYREMMFTSQVSLKNRSKGLPQPG